MATDKAPRDLGVERRGGPFTEEQFRKKLIVKPREVLQVDFQA